jgi:hypothetical protein
MEPTTEAYVTETDFVTGIDDGGAVDVSPDELILPRAAVAETAESQKADRPPSAGERQPEDFTINEPVLVYERDDALDKERYLSGVITHIQRYQQRSPINPSPGFVEVGIRGRRSVIIDIDRKELIRQVDVTAFKQDPVHACRFFTEERQPLLHFETTEKRYHHSSRAVSDLFSDSVFSESPLVRRDEPVVMVGHTFRYSTEDELASFNRRDGVLLEALEERIGELRLDMLGDEPTATARAEETTPAEPPSEEIDLDEEFARFAEKGYHLSLEEEVALLAEARNGDAEALEKLHKELSGYAALVVQDFLSDEASPAELLRRAHAGIDAVVKSDFQVNGTRLNEAAIDRIIESLSAD